MKNKTKGNRKKQYESITPAVQTHELNVLNSQKYQTCSSGLSVTCLEEGLSAIRIIFVEMCNEHVVEDAVK